MSTKPVESVALVAEKDASSLRERNEQGSVSLVPQTAKQTRQAAFTPVNLTEAIALSKMIAGSDMVPKEYKGKAGNVLVAMQYGSEIGLAPLQALQSVAVINGRPCLWGDGALAVVQASPHYESHKEWIDGQGDARTAYCQIKRKGQEYHVSTFSVQDAKKAGLWGKPGPWQQYPDRMLKMRSRGFALRDRFADALKGIGIAEEVMDTPTDTSPAKQAREAATLDIGVMTPSSEPNRGHEDTGLGKKDEQTQPEPKQDNVMCSECREVNGHKADCKYAQQDAKTSKPTGKAVYLVLEAKVAKKKSNGEPYLILECVDGENHQGKLYCWHKSFFEYLQPLSDKTCMFEVSKQDKQGKAYFQIEHILEIAGQPFVNDKPAEQGEMPAQEKSDADEDF